MKPLLVLGGLNMDILGMPMGHFSTGDSLPGQVVLRPGGVGRNIAAELARLGAPVELMTVLGDDPFSSILRDSCQALQIGLTYALEVSGPSCLYMAIHQADGDMAAAINDMAAMEQLRADQIRRLPPHAFSVCVLDANLPQQALEAAALHLEAPLVADPVSGLKADRLRPILHRLTALKPNLAEATYLTGEATPEKAAAALLRMGIRQVYISLGKRGVYAASQAYQGHLSPAHLSTSPATGAGDAMTAGIAYAIAQELSTEAAARQGLQSAQAHLENSMTGAKP